MGQKICPIDYRLIRNKKWRSLWIAGKEEFGNFVYEDYQIRRYLKRRTSLQGTARVLIRRMADKVEVTLCTSRPGLVIGKKGAEIEVLKGELRKLTNKDIWVEVEEIKRPDLEAQLVADNVKRQLERRMPFRRVMKKASQAVMDSGAVGCRIEVSGRLGGAEIARTEWDTLGRIPRQTISADIDYATATAHTTYGCIGVKVWVNRGEEKVV